MRDLQNVPEPTEKLQPVPRGGEWAGLLGERESVERLRWLREARAMDIGQEKRYGRALGRAVGGIRLDTARKFALHHPTRAPAALTTRFPLTSQRNRGRSTRSSRENAKCATGEAALGAP